MSVTAPLNDETTTTADNVGSSVSNKAEKEANSPEPAFLGPRNNPIKYRVLYDNIDNRDTLWEHVEGNPIVDEEDLANKTTAFEVVKRYWTSSTLKGEKVRHDPTTGCDKAIRIRSEAIMNALRSVVKYYPNVNLAGNHPRGFEIDWPYAILVHHDEELIEFREKCKPSNDRELCVRERDAYEHLGLLLDFLEETIMPQVREERERNQRGRYTFNMFWVPMKPGTTIAMTTAENPTRFGYVVRGVEKGAFLDPPRDWSLQLFNIDFDGIYLGRKPSSITFPKFDGENNMTWYVVIWDGSRGKNHEVEDVKDSDHGNPKVDDEHNLDKKRHAETIETDEKSNEESKTEGKQTAAELTDVDRTGIDEKNDRDKSASDDDDQDNKGWDESPAKLIERGKTFFALLQKQCKMYTGNALKFPYRKIDGLVMADMETYYKMWSPSAKPELYTEDANSRTWVTDCPCPVCKGRQVAVEARHSPFAGWDLMVPRDIQELTDQQYFLCAHAVWCFVFKDRLWEQLNVSLFQEPQFEDKMFENLVMPPERKETLKALAKSYIRVDKNGERSKRPMWTADFVHGKGNGLTFLLHGKPGVGKTCTAECVAGFTRRPLMVLTSSDVGTDPGQVENSLSFHFKTAKSWGAILLIDEADVFMERRSTDNLVRNSLVAGFLRALELYDGILFLTTNRIGTFDDAFVSRIHVHLYYPDLDEEDRRKIWSTFQDKLKKDRGDCLRLDIEAREYLNGTEIKAVQWNGREIRNAFQTAVALAEYDAEKDEEGKILVKEKHLKSVVELSRDFKKYLDKLHRGNEAKRAQRNIERLDDSRSSL